MIGRKSVIGLAVLCALVVSAFSAAGASAEQRAYTCTPEAVVKDYASADQHCVTNIGSGGGRGHVLIEAKETKITGTNEKTASSTTAKETSKLLGALAGVITEVQCTGLTGTGNLTNAAASVTGEGVITYTGCVVTKPAVGCEVVGGTIATENLTATTVGQAANRLKFTPKAPATKFATVPIKGCAGEAPPAGNYPVTGSLIAKTSGATTTTKHEDITTQNTLKFGGVKAGIEGALTISMEGGEPITLT
jgi:hypothetical protein